MRQKQGVGQLENRIQKTQIGIKNIPYELYEKFLAIQFKEGTNLNDLYIKALVNFIIAYEKKNGEIKLPKRNGEGLKGL